MWASKKTRYGAHLQSRHIPLFYMIGFLWTLRYHCPRLFNSSLHMWARSPGWHWTFPIRHLGIMTRGGFESLKWFVEARTWFYGTVRILGPISGVIFRFTAVGKVWFEERRILGRQGVHLGGGGVYLSVRCVGLWAGGVLIPRWFIPRLICLWICSSVFVFLSMDAF